MKNPRSLTAALLLLLGLATPNPADDILPGPVRDATHYRILWETSPFAVASPVAVESVQYALVGAAEFDGISYASIVDKQSSDHFVVTNQTPSHGMTLTALIHGTTPGSTYATLQKSDGILRLTLDTSVVSAAPAPAANAPAPNGVPMMTPQTSNPILAPLFRRRPHPARIFTPPIFVPRPPAASNSP